MMAMFSKVNLRLSVCYTSKLHQNVPVLSAGLASSCRNINLAGVYPPIVTPFNVDESIAYDKLASNMETWNKIPFKGYLVEGSNGEYVYLTKEERVELVKRVKEFLPKEAKKLILGGSGCESTKATIEMSGLMADAGADAVMVITPSYYKASMKDKALFCHFKAVADNSPIPVILYSVPANTGIDLNPDVVVDLATHPNIIGMKESGGDVAKIGSMIQCTRDQNFQILAGSASFYLSTLQLGGVGCVSALANVLGAHVCELEQLFYSNKMEAAVQLQRKLIAPNAAVTKGFGVAGLKLAMDWFGMYGGPTRAPLLPLSPEECEKLLKIFKNSEYL